VPQQSYLEVMASERQNGQKGGRSINDRACPSFIGSDTFVTLGRVID
jgi:hypothetical protein